MAHREKKPCLLTSNLRRLSKRIVEVVSNGQTDFVKISSIMSKTIVKIINILDVYEGRDAAITLTLYFCCLLSGFYPIQSTFHQSFQRIFKRLEDCRVVLRLYDDLTILKDFFTYELRPGVN